MKFSDLLYVTFQNFKNRKSRVFFTVLGVAVANAVVLSLVSFGYGLQKNILEKITTQESLLTLDILPSDSNIIRLNSAVIEKIQSIPQVDRISAEATLQGKASYNGIISEAKINIIRPYFFELEGKAPIAGRFFTEKDTKKIVISSLSAQLFDLAPDNALGKNMLFTIFAPIPAADLKTATSTVGQEITFGSDFDILGVVEGGGNTAEIFLDQKDLPGIIIDQYHFAKVKVTDAKYMEGVRSQLINMGFIVSSLSDVAAQANKIFSAVQVTLGTFGVFALIVAAIGLVNTMTISLLERTNEIGIMRAIGAAPADIKRIFLGESIVIGFLGGISGVVLGIMVSELLNWGFNLLASSLGGNSVRLFSYPIWFVLFIIALSTLVGLIGGLWPAHRAASMNPLQALRYK